MVLESYFEKWEDRLKTEEKLEHINNPKISFSDIINNGILKYHDEKYDVYFETIKSFKRITKQIRIELNEILKQARQKALQEKEAELKMLKKVSQE